MNLVETPKNQLFSKDAHEFLDGFYRNLKANSSLEKIEAIRNYFLEEDALVASTEGIASEEEELFVLEYYVLSEKGPK